MTNVTEIKAHRQEKTGIKLGTVGALTGGAATIGAAIGIREALNHGCRELEKNINYSQHNLISDTAYRTIDMSGLSKIGVRLRDLRVIPSHDSSLDNSSELFKMIYKRFSPLYQAANGKKAYFTAYPLGEFGIQKLKENEIIGNLAKNPTRVFKQMGHAFNGVNHSVFKTIQGAGAMTAFFGCLMAGYGAISKKSKPIDEKSELTSVQKTNNFLRDNLWKFSALAFVPSIIEEVSATLRGNSYTKIGLDPKFSSKIIKGNYLELLGHLALYTGIVASSVIAKTIKDKSVEKGDEIAQNTRKAAGLNLKKLP